MQLLFDLLAGIYAGITDQDTWRESFADMSAGFPNDPGARLLDLGCGPANSAIAYAGLRPGATIVGVDFSKGMLERGRAALTRSDASSRVLLARADAGCLPFADAAFDAVTGHSFLYLLPDRQRVLEEVRRVLRPGGVWAFMEPTTAPSGATLAAARKSRRYLASTVGWRIVSAWKGRFDEAGLRELLEGAGLAVESVVPTLGGLGLLAAGTTNRDADRVRRVALL